MKGMVMGFKLAAVLAVPTLLAALFLMLLTPRTYFRQLPLRPASGHTYLIPVPAPENGRFNFPMKITPPAPLKDLVSLEFILLPEDALSHVKEAVIDIQGHDCRLVNRPDLIPGFNDTLPFQAEGAGCSSLKTGETYDAVLSLAFEGNRRAAPHVSVSNTEEGSIEFFAPDAPGRLFARGRWLSGPEVRQSSRLDLLAWMWDMPGASTVIMAGLILAGLLGLGGIGVLTWRRRDRKKRLPLCVFLLALGLGLAYAVIVPPFQAPDEPDHFLAFARLTSAKDLIDDAQRLAKRDHFERIKFQQMERFTPFDLDAPYPVPWGAHVEDSLMEKRSILTVFLWKVFRPLLLADTAAKTLLALRLFNVFLFAVLVGLGGFFLSRPDNGLRAAFPFFIFIIPALPFLALHLSNYSVMISLLTAIGCLNLALFVRSEDWPGAGLALGFFSTLLILSGRISLTLAPWLAAVLAVRYLYLAGGQDTSSSGTKNSIRFWAGYLIGIMPLVYMFKYDLFQTSGKIVGRLASHFSTAIGKIAGAFHPALILLVVVIFFLLDFLARWIGKRFLAGKNLKPVSKGLLVLMPLGALAVIGLQVVSLFRNFKPTPNFIQKTTILPDFLIQVTKGLITSYSFRVPDNLLSRTFWVGFGWHDAFPPDLLTRILAGAAGMGLALVFIKTWRRRDASKALYLIFILAGLVGVGAATALAAYIDGQPNVSGRYLMGFHLLVLSICFYGYSIWSQPAGVTKTNRDNTASANWPVSLLPAIGILAAVSVHGYCLLHLLRRYFG